MKVLIRGIRRFLWIKFGETAQAPKPDAATRAYLDATFGPRVGMVVEGALAAKTGWVVLAGDDLCFVSRQAGGFELLSMPYRSITETKINKGVLFDRVMINTGGRRAMLQLYRDRRDIGQDFFNRLQLCLGAVRFPAA